MHGATCPSCGSRSATFGSQVRRGFGLAVYRCQDCGEELVKSRRALIPGLLLAVAVIPLLLGLFMAGEGTPTPSTSAVTLRRAGLVVLYAGLVVVSHFYVWRYLPSHRVPEAWARVRRAGRRSVPDAASLAVLPSAVVGTLVLLFVEGRQGLTAAAGTAVGVWVLLSAILVAGVVNQGPDGRLRVDGWLFAGAVGTFILAVNGLDDARFFAAAVAWGAVALVGWRTTRRR